MVGGLGRAFGGYDVTAGIAVSLACCLGVFVLLYRRAVRRSLARPPGSVGRLSLGRSLEAAVVAAGDAEQQVVERRARLGVEGLQEGVLQVLDDRP